ncbi:hypothetical protein B0H11DRAFT_449207 [Mycena galericulata]|nr:hypothetical protein B0H11DRAFT_449207 [Mycena galericulata]
MQATLKANATGTQATVNVTPADIQGLTCAINIPEEDIHKPMNMEKFICGLGAQPRLQARALGQRLGQFWENGSTITYSFIGGTSNQQSKVSLIVGLAFVFIGVTIQEVDPGQDAMIRISFDPTLGSWSYVGKANLKVRAPKATMNLASITDSPNQASSDWVLVLHEFCHVLGLVHEYQGPNDGGTLTLNDAAVYSYYSNTLGWNREIIKHQILNVYDSGSVSNYATPDSDSIMQYFMPAALDTQNVESAMPDTTLSTFDTSFLTLIYPRPQNPNGVIQACPTFGLDDTTTQNINNAYTAGNVIRMRAIVNAVLLAQRATPLLAREAR